MPKKWIRTAALTVTCVTAGAVLASTGVARAAGGALMNVFVTNDSAHPVPVAGSVSVANLPPTQTVTGTVNVASLPAAAPVQTKQLYFGDIHAFQQSGSGLTLDTSAYRQIRVTVNSGAECTPQDPAHVWINGGNLTIDRWDFYYPGANQPSKVYDLPGPTITIFVQGPAGCFGEFEVLGRS